MKKIRVFAVIIAVLGVLANTQITVAQGNITAAYNVEQAQGKAPVIKAYINGKKVSEKSEFTAKVAGADFKEDRQFYEEEVCRFDKSKEGIHYIILLDNSRSVDEKQFLQAKRELIKLRKSMAENEKMILFTVGSDYSKGEKKRIVNANGKEECRKQIKQIQALKRTKGKTVLYRSLTQVLGTADVEKLRTVVLLITDGEDDSQGKNNRTYQVNSAVKNSKIPIYGLLLKNVSSRQDKEKMRNTRKNILEEKIGRGYYEECSSVKDVSKGFQNIKSVLYKETYVVTLREENNSNRTTTDARASILCDNQEIALGKGVFTYNQVGESDTEPPFLTDIKKSGDKSVKFTVQDNQTNTVCGADLKENYTVKDKSDKEWKIEKVRFDKAQNTVELVFEDALYSGEYSIQCHNITDDSQEENAIEKSSKFSFDGLNGNVEKIKGGIKTYWWAALICIVLILGILIIVLLKKRQNKIVEVDAEALVQSDSKLIELTVTDKFGNTKIMEWNVEGSIFVGRSNICELYFEDDSLSKQHFAIEITKVACYIEDLETTNGTFVNGVKISGRRMLADGDIITAGMERFIFHAAKNEGGGKP